MIYNIKFFDQNQVLFSCTKFTNYYHDKVHERLKGVILIQERNSKYQLPSNWRTCNAPYPLSARHKLVMFNPSSRVFHYSSLIRAAIKYGFDLLTKQIYFLSSSSAYLVRVLVELDLVTRK